MDNFITGLRLSRALYGKVAPVLARSFPKLKYAAGLIGAGSEVLAFDTAQSSDHNWGPRLVLLLSDRDLSVKKVLLEKELELKLPTEVLGFSTRYEKFEELAVQGSRKLVKDRAVEIYSIGSFFRRYLDIDPTSKIAVEDWLTIPEHKLLTVAKGHIFHDSIGVSSLVQKLSYYPRDLWLYLLAAQWRRLAQKEALIGRCNQVGDALGAQILAGQIVRDLMKLCFLQERQYAPYEKWFGTAFSRLRAAKKLSPIFSKILQTRSSRSQEEHLCAAYVEVAKAHNRLKITDPLNPTVSLYHERPFRVLHADRFADEIRRQIRSSKVKSLKFDLGSIDQCSDSVVLKDNALRTTFKQLYQVQRLTRL